MPKGVRLKPEQIVAKLREIEVKIGQGKDVLSACREAGATDKSYYRWRREYGGMKVDQVAERGVGKIRLVIFPVIVRE